MFREAEILPGRIKCLKSGKGKSVLDLIIVLTCVPELPTKMVKLNKSTPRPENTFRSLEQWVTFTDAEVGQFAS